MISRVTHVTSPGEPGVGVGVDEQLHVEQLAHFREVEHQDALDEHHVRRVYGVRAVRAAATVNFDKHCMVWQSVEFVMP